MPFYKLIGSVGNHIAFPIVLRMIISIVIFTKYDTLRHTMEKILTSNDIAHLAGVSQTAVSLVLRGKWKGRVSQQVAKHILAVCEENNYRVNRVASNLKAGKSKNIALVVPDNENPFFSHILHNLREISTKLDYFCLLIETDNAPNWYSYVENAILSKEIDIAVVCYTDLPRRNPLVEQRMIFVNDYFIETNSIAIDFYTATAEAVRKLYEKGYTKLVHVRSSLQKPTFASRVAGFNDSCTKLGVFHNDIIINGHTQNDLYDQLETLQKSFSYPIGFFLDDDLFAYGLYWFAQKHHLTVGKDIGIIGADDIFICNCYNPKLSSYGYDIGLFVSKLMAMVNSIHTKDSTPEHFAISMQINDGTSF